MKLIVLHQNDSRNLIFLEYVFKGRFKAEKFTCSIYVTAKVNSYSCHVIYTSAARRFEKFWCISSELIQDTSLWVANISFVIF